MSRIASIIDSAFKPGDRGFLEAYRGREIEFYKERGRSYPEKLEEIFWAIVHGTYPNIVVIGPRGGGKTMVVYDGATTRFLFYNDDVFAIGGSKEQALNGFKYMTSVAYKDPKLAGTLEEDNKEQAVGAGGNWYRISAASTKGVRGAHPGDPHESTGWKVHGGVLIKDERDEMDDEIADAADFMIDIANPSINITTSTMHRDDGGGIALMAENAEAMGAKVFKFDIFDVSEVCQHDCAKCPMGHAFAGALLGGQSTGRKLGNGASALPRETVESTAAWTKYRREKSWPVDEPAYCAGRAKLHRPGHYRMEQIFTAFKRSRNFEIFEVEMCCRKRRGSRRVLDSALLDRSLTEDVKYIPGYDTPVGTMDWGFKGWGVPAMLQAQADHKIALLDIRLEHMMPAEGIIDIFRGWQATTGLYQVYADASHPYENAKLREAGFDVIEVAFAQWKEYNAGWLKGIVEQERFLFPGKIIRPTKPDEKPEFIFPTEDFRTAHSQCKKWRRDKHGKIVKKDDHVPDSVSSAAQHFADSFDWDPDDIQTAGKRASTGMGG